LRDIEQGMQVNSDRLQKLQTSIEQLGRMQLTREQKAREADRTGLSVLQTETILVIAIISLCQLLLVWLFAAR